MYFREAQESWRIGGLLPRYIRGSHKGEVVTTGVTCHCLGQCICEPCRELDKKEVPLWDTDICQQRTDKLLHKET